MYIWYLSRSNYTIFVLVFRPIRLMSETIDMTAPMGIR